jgi:hypothetical protein
MANAEASGALSTDPVGVAGHGPHLVVLNLLVGDDLAQAARRVEARGHPLLFHLRTGKRVAAAYSLAQVGEDSPPWHAHSAGGTYVNFCTTACSTRHTSSVLTGGGHVVSARQGAKSPSSSTHPAVSSRGSTMSKRASRWCLQNCGRRSGAARAWGQQVQICQWLRQRVKTFCGRAVPREQRTGSCRTLSWKSITYETKEKRPNGKGASKRPYASP